MTGRRLGAAFTALWLALAPFLASAQTLSIPPGGAGNGSVTSVTCGAGLSGGQFSTTGTCALAAPVSVANGGTGATSAGGTALDNISGFASTGLVERTGAGTYGFITAPAGTIVGTSDSQTLTNKSIAASEINSGQVAVAQGGTGASSLAGAGLPVLLSMQTPTGTGTVTFSSISTAYTDLEIVVRGAGTAAATFVNVEMQFNGDSGSNYDGQEFYYANSTTGPGVGIVAGTYMDVGWLPAASGVTNLGGGGAIRIFDYNGTTYFKEIQAQKGVRTGSTDTATYVGLEWGSWRSTSAITSITVLLSSGNFASGSKVSLYGIP